MADINLLPRKEFEIVLNDGTIIPGKYCTWAMKRFGDKKGYSLKQLEEITSADKMSFDDACTILLCSIEYMSRKNGKPFSWTDVNLCDWIDELGGLMSEKVMRLFAHAQDEYNESKEEKKSEEATGLISLEPIQPAVTA